MADGPRYRESFAGRGAPLRSFFALVLCSLLIKSYEPINTRQSRQGLLQVEPTPREESQAIGVKKDLGLAMPTYDGTVSTIARQNSGAVSPIVHEAWNSPPELQIRRHA